MVCMHAHCHCASARPLQQLHASCITACVYLLPQVLARLDAVQGRRAALEAALRGVFAGNIFDLGAAASAKRYADGGGAGFDSALAQLLPRPWVC